MAPERSVVACACTVDRSAVHARRDARRRRGQSSEEGEGRTGGTARCGRHAACLSAARVFSCFLFLAGNGALPVCVSNRLPLYTLAALSTARRLDYHGPISSAPSLLYARGGIDSADLPRCTAFCFPARGEGKRTLAARSAVAGLLFLTHAACCATTFRAPA